VKVYGERAYLYRNLARWVPLFKAGKSNFMDETHNGRPITEINIASIDLLQSLTDKNPRISHSNLEEQTFLPLGTHYLIILRYIKAGKTFFEMRTP
jgi:hypothetical protein